ncbi:MAG: hypothetical protein ACREFX_00280, partial [Opitutaceae bacterium]
PDAAPAGSATVTTTGAQTYGGAVALQRDTTLQSSGGGTIAFNGTVDGGFALAVETSGATQFGKAVGAATPLASLSVGSAIFDVPGSATATPTVTTSGAQDYAGAVTLRQNTVLSSTGDSGPGITLEQAVSGTGFALELDAPQTVVSALGDLGSESGRLASVSTDGGDVNVTGNIWAQGNISLGIGNEVASTGNSYLAFNTGTDPADTRIDSAAGTITLGSGTGGSALKTSVPLASSIYKSNPGDLYLFASSIVVEPLERLAVGGGSLIAVSDGTAAGDGITLSSTAAANYLVLSTASENGPSIFLRSRGPANVLPTTPSGTPAPDLGTDLVAGAVLFFNARFGTIPTRAQFAPASPSDSDFFDYAAHTGNIISSGGPLVLKILPDSSGAHNVFVADLLANNNFRPIIPNLVYLNLSTKPGFSSLQNSFISQENFGSATAISLRTIVSTGADPRDSLEEAFVPEVPIGQQQAPAPEAELSEGVREQLQALGIYARRLLPKEILSRQWHEGLFVAIPEKAHPQLSDYQVADARVEDRSVREVIRLAVQIGLLGKAQGKLNPVASSLAKSYDAFSSAFPQGDANAFRSWLRTRHDPDAARIVGFTSELREVMRRIALLGLTRKELAGSKAQIYGSILSPRLYVDPQFLQTLVEGSQTDGLPKRNPVALTVPAFPRAGFKAADS